MLANPIVEEVMLAGRTPPAAVAQFQMWAKKRTWDNLGHYAFGCIRICPPLKVPERFRGYVTWLPTQNGAPDVAEA